MNLSRRDTLRIAAAGIATSTSPLAAASAAVAGAETAAPPAPATGALGDYELTITLDFDFQDYSETPRQNMLALPQSW